MITKIEELQWQNLVAIKTIWEIANRLDNMQFYGGEFVDYVKPCDIRAFKNELMDIIIESGFVQINKFGNLEFKEVFSDE